MSRSSSAALVFLMAPVFGAWLVGCAPKIGSKCIQNTDCGSSGTLICDTSQPGGYCTQFNCAPNSCQDNAVCVEFLASVPGCPYDDYRSPARTGRTFCMEHCVRDSDCQVSEGYVCRNPSQPPWGGAIIDNNQSQSVCIVQPDRGAPSASGDGPTTLPDGSICSPSGPVVPPIDAGVQLESPPEAGFDGGSIDGAIDGGMDAGSDAGSDAGDGGEGDAAFDGSAEAGGLDAQSDAAPDAGAADAQGGG